MALSEILKPFSVKESIKQLQSFPENDKIFYLYVLDNKEKLVGVVS